MEGKHIIFTLAIGVLVSAWVKYNSSKNTASYRNISYYQVYSLNRPDSVEFCQERVPLEKEEVQKKLDKAIFKLSYLRRKNNRVIQRAEHWFPQMEKILTKQGVPEDFKYMAIVESNLRSEALSPRGALGFWQFIPSTAKAMGLRVDAEVDERKDPIKSTNAACRYLKKSYRQLNNWTNVAASYNMGVSGIQRQLLSQRKASYYDLKLNRETGDYVYRIVALKEILKDREKELAQEQPLAFNYFTNGLLNYYL